MFFVISAQVGGYLDPPSRGGTLLRVKRTKLLHDVGKGTRDSSEACSVKFHSTELSLYVQRFAG